MSVGRFGGSCRDWAAARRIGLEDEAPRRVVRRRSFVKSTDGRCGGSARSRSWVSCSPCIQTTSSPPTIKGIATSSWSRLRIAWCVPRCRCAGPVDRCLRSDVTSAAIHDASRRERWVGGRGAADRATRGALSYSHRPNHRHRRGRARRARRVRRAWTVARDAGIGRPSVWQRRCCGLGTRRHAVLEAVIAATRTGTARRDESAFSDGARRRYQLSISDCESVAVGCRDRRRGVSDATCPALLAVGSRELADRSRRWGIGFASAN